MLERDVGVYEAVATNEHGESRQRVRLEIAEYPRFLRRPGETFIMAHRNGRLEARVIGIPTPEIKWYKDWQPLAESARIKVRNGVKSIQNIMKSANLQFYFHFDRSPNTTQTFMCCPSTMLSKRTPVCTRAVPAMWLAA